MVVNLLVGGKMGKKMEKEFKPGRMDPNLKGYEWMIIPMVSFI